MPHPVVIDTLSCDSSLLHRFQNDEAYDYGRELYQPDNSLWEWLTDELVKWMDHFFSVTFSRDTRELWIGALIVFLLFVVYLVYRKHPSWFRRLSSHDQESMDAEDTIYGVDFDYGIASAMQGGNYREAVRLIYLQTLRWLSDNHAIDWQIYKTPSRYLREYDRREFRLLTRHFVRVRYGNFDADEALVQTMLNLQLAIKEGGEPSHE